MCLSIRYLRNKIVGALGESARKQEAKRKEDNGARTTQGNEQPPGSVLSTGSESGRASTVQQGPQSEGGTLALKAIEPEYKTRDRSLYKSCILFTKFNNPPNLVGDAVHIDIPQSRIGEYFRPGSLSSS